MSATRLWTALGFAGNPYDQSYLSGTEEGAALFLGRELELSEVQVGLASGGSHMAIEGDAGVGKTSLARVAGYELHRTCIEERNGSLFLSVPVSLQLGTNASEFELGTWRAVANALIDNVKSIRHVGLDVPDLDGLAAWLNSPFTATSASASVMGFGAGGGRTLNTSSGFGQSGFASMVQRQLDRIFPRPEVGGVICIMDNLELLGTDDEARAALEAIRSPLLEMANLRWVMVGSKGVVTRARSRRLSGFIERPLHLRPLSVDQAVELVARRLEYWGNGESHAPVQPEDFRYLYRTLGQNLRDSLAMAQSYARHYYTEFLLSGGLVPTVEERPLYFQSWVAATADATLEAASGISEEGWGVFRKISQSGEPFLGVTEEIDSSVAIRSLRRAQLLDVEPDPLHQSASRVTLTANGWLCVAARARPSLPSGGGLITSVPWGTSLESSSRPYQNYAGLPSSCRLVELLGLESLDAKGVLDIWMRSSSFLTKAPIGASVEGVFALDFNADGPHVLIAGTTGSGKSELLRSLLAAMAVLNAPDQVNFLLVDYKGGAAFAPCERLPHVVGLITDIDRYEGERLLASLEAEVDRRHSLLASYHSFAIDDYQRRRRDSSLPSLPYLFVVIDEFAALVYEVPDFLPRLSRIVGLGRSLGLVLILATQRPAGVISTDLSHLLKLRIALRVSSDQDSVDVVGVPDAALIPPELQGRAIARLGGDRIVSFQTGFAGPRRASGWPDDLDSLVTAVQNAYFEVGEPPIHHPVAPPLLNRILLSDILGQGQCFDSAERFPYGLEDFPRLQEQRLAAIDLNEFSNMAIVGGRHSGLSQTFRTIAGSMALIASESDVQIYAIDSGSGGLLVLQNLPHCQKVVTRANPEEAAMLLGMLASELGRRVGVMSAGGFDGVRDQRSQGSFSGRLPHVFLLIDRWEGLVGAMDIGPGSGSMEHLRSLLRDGPPLGIHCIIAGDVGLLDSEIGSLIDEIVVLALPDRASYRRLGLHDDQVPLDMPPGRGVRVPSGTEVQVAVLSADPISLSEASALRRIGEMARKRQRDVSVAADED